MRNIKGLIAKDVLTQKKMMLMMLGVSVLFMVFMIIARLGYDYGKLQGMSPETVNMMYPVFVILFFTVPGQVIVASIESDYKSDWFRYSFSSGTSRKEILLSKIVETAAAFVITGPIIIVINLTLGKIFAGAFSEHYMLLSLCIFFIMASMIVLQLPLYLIFKSREKVIPVLVLPAIALGFLISRTLVKFMTSFDLKEDDDPEKIIIALSEIIGNNADKIILFTIVFTVISLLVAFGLYYVLLGRRERICGG